MPTSISVRIAALVAAMLITAGSFGCVAESPTTQAERIAFQSISAGMTDEDVVERLGEPRHDYARQNAPSPYYVKGYAHKSQIECLSTLALSGSCTSIWTRPTVLRMFLSAAADVTWWANPPQHQPAKGILATVSG
jgi:hypothetical protein